MPRALDLFCGGGGISVGLFNSGFEVVGVDIESQSDYPFEFIQKNVFDLDLDFLKKFDLITASPPCQGYIYTNRNNPNYLRLIEPVRELLDKTEKPYIIENVPGSPIKEDLMLCGEMFGLKVLRHRFFEIKGFHIPQLKHLKHKGFAKDNEYISVFSGSKRGAKPTWLEKKQAMQIFWITKEKTLHNAIPPKYYEYIGKQFKKPEITLMTQLPEQENRND